jgi:hypothetical protein
MELLQSCKGILYPSLVRYTNPKEADFDSEEIRELNL